MKTSSLDDVHEQLKAKTSKSYQFSLDAQSYMPGGVTANIKYFDPYPIVMQRGSGAYLFDIDGNEYIDYLLSYGSLMLGHGHPKVQNALADQMQVNGTHLFGTPHQLELEMAKKLQALYPSMEKLRYTNSGTEATLLSIRLAYAYTGKYKIAKFEGHYHGGYDQMLISVNPKVDQAGPASEPNALIESKGVDPYHETHTIVLPFNNLEATAEILTKHKDEVAAVILEPAQSGFIPATQEFMTGLRKITKDLGIVLIFDEVKTGFRLGLGGAQSIYHISPDLTTLGKVVGGGFPVGMVGGKEEIMMCCAPSAFSDVFDHSTGKNSSAKDVLFHSGTYNGHPSILAAGMATIDVLQNEISTVIARTHRLKQELTSLFERKGLTMQTIGLGSIFNIVFTDKEIWNYRDLQEANFALRKRLDLLLLINGLYTKPMNRFSLSTAHTDLEINRTLEIFEKALQGL